MDKNQDDKKQGRLYLRMSLKILKEGSFPCDPAQ